MQKQYCATKETFPRNSKIQQYNNLLKMPHSHNRCFIDCGGDPKTADLTKICQVVKSHRTNTAKKELIPIDKNIRIIAIKPRSLKRSSTSLNNSFRNAPTYDNECLQKKRIHLFSNK